MTAVVRITVTRTGGFAGLRRTWTAEADADGAAPWLSLIDGCDWDAASSLNDLVPTGADRYIWVLDARWHDTAREAALTEPDVTGPWRDLVDAVRDARNSASSPTAPGRTDSSSSPS